MIFKNKKRVLRVILAVLLLLLVAAIGFPIWFNAHYKQFIAKKLPGWVAKGTDSLYKVSVGDIEISIISKKVTIKGVHLRMDSLQFNKLKSEHRLPKTIFDIDIPFVEASGIKWADLIAEREFSCKRFTISQPELVISKVTEDTAVDAPKTNPKRSRIEKISARYIDVIQPRISYMDNTSTDSLAIYLKGGRLSATDWIFDPAQPRDTSRLLYAKAGNIQLDSFVFKKAGNFYAINTGNIHFASDQNDLVLKNLKVLPGVSKDEFYRKTGYQKELYSMDFPTITCKGFSWKYLLNSGNFRADSIELDSPRLAIYMDRIPPPNMTSKMGNYPHQMLLKLNTPVEIRCLTIKNGWFDYTERNFKTKKEGILPLRNVNGTITNITNIPSAIEADPHCMIRLKGGLMGSELKAIFDLSLAGEAGDFQVTGSLAAMDGTKINPLTGPVALAEMKSLQIRKADFTIAGNDKKATATMLLLYNDLKVRLMGVSDDGDLTGQGLMSFLANTALLYPDNPMPGLAVRNSTATVMRDPYKSFFNLIWKTLFTSMLKTVGRNPRVADMVNNRQKATEDKRRMSDFGRRISE